MPPHLPTPPFAYPAGATLQEKLLLATARVELARVFDRVRSAVPDGFGGTDLAGLDVRVAIRECLSRDAPLLALLPEATVAGPSGSALSTLARSYLGRPVGGHLSGLSGLPWLRVRFPDPAADWADELWRAGAKDFIFADLTGDRVFAAIHDDHDDEITVIGTEAAELVRRAVARGTW